MPAEPKPKQVLVTEDQALIALSISHELSEAGCKMIGPFATCLDAETWLATDTPDFAILDIELADGPCTKVALDLRARGVPFAVFSGSRRGHVPEVFLTAPWYEKPGDLQQLIATFGC